MNVSVCAFEKKKIQNFNIYFLDLQSECIHFNLVFISLLLKC